MSALGFVSGTAQSPPQAPAAPASVRVALEDVLASSRRLWLRGRVQGLPAKAESDRRWWDYWTHKSAPETAPPQLHLVTKISGSTLEADAPINRDGWFEAQLEVSLPPVRRGWRVARNHLHLNDHNFDVCSLVLSPPEGTTGAIAVVLPPEATLTPGRVPSLANSAYAAQLAAQLRAWEPETRGWQHVYYLACVPPDAEHRAAEMALATTALGWPAGTFVLLPADPRQPRPALELGLARLQWLFEGGLPLRVFDGDKPQSVSGGWQVPPVAPARVLGRPARSHLVPRYPVVFCHGMLACSLLRMSIPVDCNSFSPMRDLLRERGFRVLYPQVPPTSGVAERAAELRRQILTWTDEPVNIVAHSMGGLDARYLITHLDMAARVRSLTTISTPHRGTHLADWVLENYHQRVPLLLAMESFGINIDGFRACRPAACAAFNAITPDHPDVRYFSYGASVPLSRLSPVLRRAWNILRPLEGDNDGMVSVQSARWGQYLGTIAADHFAQTPDLALVRPGEDFDVLGFYTRLVEDLARRGF